MTVRLLRTFGGLALVEGDGSSALPEAAQRRLVLLALAVEAGDRGLPRDRAIAFLWPEVDEEHARRSLNQLRYTLRRELDADPLVGTLTLRPDSAVLTSDLEQFRAAVAAGRVDAALALHAAPFLDGVALGGGLELDEWAEACRSEAAAHSASSSSARPATRTPAATPPAPRSLWRRLIQLEPLAAPSAVGTHGDTRGPRATRPVRSSSPPSTRPPCSANSAWRPMPRCAPPHPAFAPAPSPASLGPRRFPSRRDPFAGAALPPGHPPSPPSPPWRHRSAGSLSPPPSSQRSPCRLRRPAQQLSPGAAPRPSLSFPSWCTAIPTTSTSARAWSPS